MGDRLLGALGSLNDICDPSNYICGYNCFGAYCATPGVELIESDSQALCRATESLLALPDHAALCVTGQGSRLWRCNRLQTCDQFDKARVVVQ